MERFWSKVVRGEGCWLWTGALNEAGYGVLWHEGRTNLAHRVAWMLERGEPLGLVLHRCDVRRCVRPDHLFLGTHADNTDDMMSKGRGRKQFASSLTEEELEAAFARVAAGESMRSVSRSLGKSPGFLGMIKKRSNPQ